MSTSPETFDPYSDWLGIGSHERPIDYYRLLGLARLESDSQRIAAAADERMALVRTFQVGPRGRFTQKLLNELAAAKVCLLSPSAKAAYDAALSRSLAPPLATALPDPAAPPVQPPPIAAASQSPSAEQSLADAELVQSPSGASSWTIMLAVAAAGLVMLAGATLWSILQNRRPRVEIPVVSRPTLPEEPPAPQTVVQLQEANGEVNLSPDAGTLTGGVELQHAGTDEILSQWSGPEAAAEWRLKLVEPGFFQVEIIYACTAENSAVEVAVGERSKECELRTCGGLDRFLTDTFTLVIPASGEHTLVLRPTKHPEGDWLAVKSVRLVPVGRSAPSVLTPPEG